MASNVLTVIQTIFNIRLHGRLIGLLTFYMSAKTAV